VLRLQSLFDIRCNTLLANHSHFFSFGRLVPLPSWCKVRAALGADEGLGQAGRDGVQVEDAADALLQPAQVDKLRVGRVGDEMHFWWRGLGRGNL